MKTIILTGLIFLAAVGLAFAQGNMKNNFFPEGMMMGNMMDGSRMMHDSDGEMGAGCMGMMENMDSLSIEEKEKMLADMDKDMDGKCDMCGMAIEMCRRMMSLP